MPEATAESRAREMGWQPKDEFRGDPEKWVDAEEYVRRGEEVLPLVKAENRRLHQRTDELAREVARLSGVIQENVQSMEDLKKFSQEQLKERLSEQRRTIMTQLREARRDGEDERVIELEEALDENKEAVGKLKEPPAAAPPPPAPPQTVQEAPEYRAWIEKNPWFGGSSRGDQAKTAAAQRFAVEIATAGKRGQAFFDAVDAAMDEAFPQQRRSDPTEEGRPSASGGGGGGSGSGGFASLPAEAKAKARQQSSRFVGENKMFKTEDAWFKYYAEQYNASEAA